jgi:hypothetical protein
VDHQRNTDTRERLQVQNIVEGIGYVIIKKIGKSPAEKLERPLLGVIKMDHHRNTDTRERLQVQNIVEDIGYVSVKKTGKSPAEKVEGNRLPKLTLYYKIWQKRKSSQKENERLILG